jgi:NADPH:quinone reductase-like Zn-dependent oxidoreductase
MTSLRYLTLSVAVTVTALFLPSLHAVEDEKSSLPIAIVVHGGAGSVGKKWLTKEREQERREILEKAGAKRRLARGRVRKNRVIGA